MNKLMKTLAGALLALVLVANQGFAQTLLDAQRHLNAERFTKAGEAFKAIVAANPTTENYFELGRYYLLLPDAQKHIAEAKDAFEKGNALEKKGDDLNTIGLGWVKVAEKDAAGAKLIFDEIIKKSKSKNPELLYRIAEGYVSFPWFNDPGEAVMLIDKALEVKKVENPEYYVIRAKAFDLKNEGGDVMNALQNAVRFGAKDKAAVYSLMSKIWLQGKNYKEAQEAIENSITADKEHAPAYKYQSSFYQTYQEWEKSAEAAQNYLKYSDGDCAAKLRYTKIAFIAKDFDNVLSKINEISSCTEEPIIYRLSGISKYELDRPTDAISDLNEFLKKAPGKEEIFGLDYGFIGRSYLKLAKEGNTEQNVAKAVEYMEKAVAMKDTTFDYYTELGTYFQEKRDYVNAAKYVEKAIASKGKEKAEDLYRLAVLQYMTRDYVKAGATFEKVAGIYKEVWEEPFYMSAVCQSYAIPNDTTFSAANKYIAYIEHPENQKEEKMKANASKLANAYNYLAAKTWLIDKDTTKAISYIDQVLVFDPTYQPAIDLKNSIMGITPATAPKTSPDSTGSGK